MQVNIVRIDNHKKQTFNANPLNKVRRLKLNEIKELKDHAEFCQGAGIISLFGSLGFLMTNEPKIAILPTIVGIASIIGAFVMHDKAHGKENHMTALKAKWTKVKTQKHLHILNKKRVSLKGLK